VTTPGGVDPWRVAGSYFEACSCDAVCPCRVVGGRPGGRSTYGVCDFALSWWVRDGRFGEHDLSDLKVVMAGSYNDDEDRSPWRVALYVDDRADDAQHTALSDIFLGRAGGTSLRNFAAAIREVYAVRRATIELEHAPTKQHIKAGTYVTVEGVENVDVDETVACGIPGVDRPGQEVRTALQKVTEPPLRWEVRGRCGFAADFDYRSD